MERGNLGKKEERVQVKAFPRVNMLIFELQSQHCLLPSIIVLENGTFWKDLPTISVLSLSPWALALLAGLQVWESGR